MSFRRRSREIALQILFQREFSPHSSLEDTFNLFLKHFDMTKETRDFAEFLTEGTLSNLSKIDQAIASHSKNWRLERMSIVDRSILRIAAFELLFCQEKTPPEAVINEAIEISKKYSSHDSPSFINGILDNILKSSQR
ncbi:MAG: transcription antitermination factor NusB [Oligoflexia bacterium]|nr:transcription antitermination factor NusB [Oligoflexia bacterium]